MPRYEGVALSFPTDALRLLGVAIVKRLCRHSAADKKFVGKLVALAEFLLLLDYKSIKSKFI